MKLNKYISLNIFSTLFYLMLFEIIFVYVIQVKLNFLFISTEKFFIIYTALIYISILLLFLFFIEKVIYKKFPGFIIKTNNSNVIIKNIYNFLFYCGLYLNSFNIIIFIFFTIFLVVNA